MDDKETSDSINEGGKQLLKAYELVSDQIDSHGNESIPEDEINIHFATGGHRKAWIQ